MGRLSLYIPQTSPQPYQFTKSIGCLKLTGDIKYYKFFLDNKGIAMINICSVCKKKKEVYRNRKSRLLVCLKCGRKDPSKHRECSNCGDVGPVAKRRGSGELLCEDCHRKDPSTHGKCSRCEETKRVHRNRVSDELICEACAQLSRYHDNYFHEECDECGRFRLPSTRTDSCEAICQTCSREKKTGICIICTNERTIVALGKCSTCYKESLRLARESADSPA